jgi:hypothetical protein
MYQQRLMECEICRILGRLGLPHEFVPLYFKWSAQERRTSNADPADELKRVRRDILE